MATKRPRNNNNTNVPPAKRARVIVDRSIDRMINSFTKKLNIPKDSYNLGTITNLTNTNMGVRLSRKLVDDLKRVYQESYDRQIEHVGSTQFTVRNTRGAVKFNTPSKRTNERYNSVNPGIGDVDSYVVYHSHPVPPDNRTLFTIPSIPDIKAYIETYPIVQANIILEKRGYYVIDLIESDMFKKPTVDEVVEYYNGLLATAKFDKVMTIHRNIMFFNSDTSAWKKTINGYIDKMMRSKFGISIRYYTYDELAQITLIDKNKIMLP
jgi:hypothetical protein